MSPVPPSCPAEIQDHTLTNCDHSGLLELCLDLNQNPSIPPELRFNVAISNPPPRVSTGDKYNIPANITPEEANANFLDYNHMMRQGNVPPLDVAEVRSQIDAKLAAQGAEPLDTLEQSVSRPIGSKTDVEVDPELGFMTFEQELDYIARLDAKLSMTGGLPTDPRHRDVEQEKHYADLTPRELERKTEFENPQSQHNWLRTHTKVLGTEGDGDDTESLASHDMGSGKPYNKRKSGVAKGSLAKQVGDRAVERAREGSTALSHDEDEFVSDAALGSASGGKKRARDPDGTYRLKGAKSAGGRGKRKRSGEDLLGSAGGTTGGVGGGSGTKKAKMEGSGGAGAGTPASVPETAGT